MEKDYIGSPVVGICHSNTKPSSRESSSGRPAKNLLWRVFAIAMLAGGTCISSVSGLGVCRRRQIRP